jgi:tetratricopeptide (TPR) repeat protein
MEMRKKEQVKDDIRESRRNNNLWKRIITMTTRSISPLFIFSIILMLNCSCSRLDEAVFNEALRLYRQNKLEQALPFFERAVERDPNNAEAFAWLAETYRRLDKPQQAVQAARKSLALNSHQSFAHTVLADTYNPQYREWKQASYDTTWRHLLLAVNCDPNDGNAWLSVWIEAMRRGEDALWKKALCSMVRTKFITPSLLAYNRWVLNHLPQNALLFTNGDMDTYPAVALQVMERFRTDVAIVNISLLNLPWYARFVSKQYNVPLSFRDWEIDSLKPLWGPEKTIITISNQIVQGWFKEKEENRLSMPLAIAGTVDYKCLPNVHGRIKNAGPYSLWFPQKVDSSFDIEMMRINIESIHPLDFTGPNVAPQDRSPVRITNSDGITRSVVCVVLNYADVLHREKRSAAASRALDLAEEIDKNYKPDGIFKKEILDLRKSLKH